MAIDERHVNGGFSYGENTKRSRLVILDAPRPELFSDSAEDGSAWLPTGREVKAVGRKPPTPCT